MTMEEGMEAISTTEHEAVLESFNELINTVMDDLIEATVAPLRGRTVRTIRKFKDSTGEYKEHTVTVTVTGGRLDYDGGLVLIGTYPHPHSGKLVPTDVLP
jgi:hypothetical protein